MSPPSFFLNIRWPWQIIVTVLMLVVYWALLAFVPCPGHAIGVVKEGCNVGDWLNDWIMGDWQGQFRFGWILGILGHASTAMLGVFAGQLLRSTSTPRSKVLWLGGLGVFCLFTGMFWGGWIARWFPGVVLFGEEWSRWPIWCPIIKNRWTSAYALYAGGWSYLLLALFYLVIDVWGLRRWAFPFIVIGANALVAYMAWATGQLGLLSPGRSALGRIGTIRRPLAGSHPGGRGVSAVLWLLLWYMYRNRTFIRA